VNGRAALPNPFDSDVVANPSQTGIIDVPEIHQRPFEVVCEEYERVLSSAVSRSVLFSGEAGCGKTHLLSRFRRWLRGEMAAGPSAPPAVLITVRMETAPSQLWRHLRHRMGEQLLEPLPDGTTVLDGLLKRVAARLGGGDLGAALDRSRAGLTLECMRVLEQFAEGKHRRLSRAWLKGEPLPDADRELLGLAGTDPEDLEEDSGEMRARSFVLSMTRLCAPEAVVFCFDQIEALALATAANSFGPFTRLGASLMDETSNSLVVSSVLANYLQALKSIQASDYDRIAKVTQDVTRLTWSLGLRLIEARLDSVEALRPHRSRSRVAPLREQDLRRCFDVFGQATARKLIHEAKVLFQAWQGVPARPKVPLEQFLQTALEALRERAARSDDASADEILAHGLPAAARLAGFRIVDTPRKEIDFEAGPETAPLLVALCNQPHATSLYHKLRRLQNALDAQSIRRLCLVRDPRLPVSANAHRTRQMLNALASQGARIVRPDPEVIAAIDAIRKLIAQATSGDLSHEGEAVTADAVRNWLKDHLPDALTSFVEDLRGGTRPVPDPLASDPLLDLLRVRKVVAAEEAANTLGWSPEQVVQHARANPGQAGVVDGAVTVLFHVVTAGGGGADGSS
jgi:hypothetical protein